MEGGKVGLLPLAVKCCCGRGGEGGRHLSYLRVDSHLLLIPVLLVRSNICVLAMVPPVFSLFLVTVAFGLAQYVSAQQTRSVRGTSKIPRTAPVFNKTPYFGGWVTADAGDASVVGTTMRTWNGQVR